MRDRFVFADGAGDIPEGSSEIEKDDEQYIASGEDEPEIARARELLRRRNEGRLVFADGDDAGEDIPEGSSLHKNGGKRYVMVGKDKRHVMTYGAWRNPRSNGRLVFADGGKDIPEGSALIKRRSKRYVKVGEDELEVMTLGAWRYRQSRKRLVFANGDKIGEAIPEGSLVIDKDGKKYIKVGEDEWEIMTAGELSQRRSDARLVYAKGGEDIPEGSSVITREDNKQYIKVGEDEREIMTAKELYTRGRGRLVFANGDKNGEAIPEGSVLIKRRSKRYVKVGEDECEVMTYGAWQSRRSRERLVLANGDCDIPEGSSVFEKEDKKQYITVGGDEREVVSAGSKWRRRSNEGRLVFYNGGGDIPEGSPVIKKEDNKQYIKVGEDEHEVVTYAAWRNRRSNGRLVFADGDDNGMNIPEGSSLIQRGSGRYLKVGEAERKVVTYGAWRKYQKAGRSVFVDSEEEDDVEEVSQKELGACVQGAFSNEVKPLGGVSEKYFQERVARLPELEGSAAASSAPAFASHLEFMSLGGSEYHTETSFSSLSFHWSSDEGVPTRVNLTLHTYNPIITSKDKPVFVFAGRKREAFIPNVQDESNLRIILVGPKSDFEAIKGCLKPGIDFLEIEELSSGVHGRYEHLGLLNARRLAACIWAGYLYQTHKIPYAMMSDDNLKSVHFNREGEVSWDVFFSDFAAQLDVEKSVCVSVPTISSNGIRKIRVGELGSKLYMFDMTRISEKLGGQMSHWFFLSFPANANKLWGEDYYFQLMLQRIFASSRGGYCILNSARYGVQRTSLPSLCRKVVRTADALCETDIETLFGEGLGALKHLQGLDFNPYQCVKETIVNLQSIIKGNIERHQRLLNQSRMTCLMKAHAWANKLEHRVIATQALAEAAFLSALQQQLELVSEMGRLYEYQKEVLREVCKHLGGQRFIGQINMATGTGKTYVEIYLAIAALLTGTTQPIMIVTPYMQLVLQAYQDFIKVLREFPELPIQASQILKVDSEVSSISVETLERNRTLEGKSCVMIVCQDSFAKILASDVPHMRRYQRPCMLLVDESHMQTSSLEKYCAMDAEDDNSFLCGLSATPKPNQVILGTGVVIEYAREEAVKQGYLTPCILDKFDGIYTREHVLDLIDQMPNLLSHTAMPSGGVLADGKGIIYVPNTFRGINYSQRLKEVLDKAGIAAFEINSNEPDSKENLEAYKNYHAHSNAAKILICKGMAKIGFSRATAS